MPTPPPASTLSGLSGIETRVSGSVRLARAVGELELAGEGAALLERGDAARLLPPGAPERHELIQELIRFERRALEILAKYV